MQIIKNILRVHDDADEHKQYYYEDDNDLAVTPSCDVKHFFVN